MRKLNFCCAVVVALVIYSNAGNLFAEAPKLIVVLVVDQMRADAIERYQHNWTAGLRRLVNEGAWFRQARYSYFGTLTCAGHATISTGTVPATHGMILDGWWDTTVGRRVRCTADSAMNVVRYGSGGREQHGPSNLTVPTLADALRTQREPDSKIVAFSIKSRAAIPLSGQRADAVAWFDDGNAWTTSTAFTSEPVPFIANWVKQHPVENAFGHVWTPSLRPEQFRFTTDDKTSFAHQLGSSSNDPDTAFYNEWKRSPLADEYVVNLGIAAVDALDLETQGGTNYLALGFSASDYVGHDFGPRSLELQDLYFRLDATIGKLLNHLDETIGRNHYVVTLTADHGLGPSSDRAVALGFDAGRISRQDVLDQVNRALEPVLGPGQHATGMTHTDFYFDPQVHQTLLENPKAMRTAIDALKAVPGVRRVFQPDELLKRPFTDPLTEQVARSYYPGRSGDLIVIPKPYWYTWIRQADHGTGYDYDVRVPVIFYGAGIESGHYWTSAAPSDIAPTLALLAGVTLPHPDGHVLTEALAASH